MKKPSQLRWKASMCGRLSENRWMALALCSLSTGMLNFGTSPSVYVGIGFAPLTAILAHQRHKRAAAEYPEACGAVRGSKAMCLT
jgi:hypothetical protein